MLRRAARVWAERGWVSGRWLGVPAGRIALTSRSGARLLHARAGDDSRPGVYGLRGLHAPEDFARLASAATATSESIARDLRAGLRKGVDVIDDLDDISDAVCSVVDVAELCRNTHADARWVRAAERAYVDLQAYVHALNADRGLYLALVETHERHLRAVERARRDANGLPDSRGSGAEATTGEEKKKNDTSADRLSAEAARVALTLRRDFERGGIHLDDARRSALERASSAVVRHGMSFQRNLLDPDALGTAELDRSELRGLPPSTAARLSLGGANVHQPPGRARVPLDQRTLGQCMRWVESRDARERVYRAAYGGPEANRAELARLLRARAEVAEILGFDSHARYAVAPLMAGTPEAVRATLDAARDATNERLVAETEHMRRFFPNGENEKKENVRSWDRAFLAGRARAALASERAAAGGASSADAYFGLARVVAGVSKLAERVFGVALVFAEFLPGEAWCADARKLEARDAETGERLGTVYLDLAPRAGKFPHAAHFVARCSRDVKNRRTLPSVALVCNFGRVGGAFEETYLAHAELETFMHELGHAMHSVLSRTKYQHLSGTRCAADLVEVPSHVFEYFAWDEDAISLLSAHRVTGDSMPAALLRRLRRGKDLFAATDLRQQIVFAGVDLETHAMPSGTIDADAIRDVASRVSERGFHPWNSDSGSRDSVERDCAWELRFGHVVGYASTYYSYVYARLVAAAVWETHFSGGALEPGAGRRLTDGILRRGGAVAPEALVRDLLGRDALLDVAGGIAPDNRAALRELEKGGGFF